MRRSLSSSRTARRLLDSGSASRGPLSLTLSTLQYDAGNPVVPIGPGLDSQDEWWFRGPSFRALAPAARSDGAVEQLPAGGSITFEVACHVDWTSLGRTPTVPGSHLDAYVLPRPLDNSRTACSRFSSAGALPTSAPTMCASPRARRRSARPVLTTLERDAGWRPDRLGRRLLARLGLRSRHRRRRRHLQGDDGQPRHLQRSAPVCVGAFSPSPFSSATFLTSTSSSPRPFSRP